MYHQYREGYIEVICGCMFAGKTEELIRRINVLSYAKQKILVFKPKIDDRYSEIEIASHSGRKVPCYAIDDPEEILDKVTDDVQVGILSLRLLNNDIIISFEGTDNTFIGWKEDFALSYEYPTKSHLIASKYVSDTLNKNNCNIYLCGHSKGGNLALVSALRLLPSKKSKVKKIYSFDGPGIPADIFKSMDYNMIKDRLINIIPNYSIVGVLLYQENLNVIKSDAIGIMQHEISSWKVEDDHLLRCEESSLSKELDVSIKVWLTKTTHEERRQIIDEVFDIFVKSGIKTTDDIKENKIKSVNMLLKNLNGFSKESRTLFNNYMKMLIGEVGTNIINDKKKVIKEKISELKDKYDT